MANEDPSNVISDVEEYFYFEDELTDIISSWAEKNCTSFDEKDPRSVEQPLLHTQLYNEFLGLFEKLLEGFLESKSITIVEFYKHMKSEENLALREKGKLSISATFGSVLLSTTDFFIFCEMMHGVKMGQGVVFCPPLIEADASDYDSSPIDIEADSKSEPYKADEKKSACSSYQDVKSQNYDSKPMTRSGGNGFK